MTYKFLLRNFFKHQDFECRNYFFNCYLVGFHYIFLGLHKIGLMFFFFKIFMIMMLFFKTKFNKKKKKRRHKTGASQPPPKKNVIFNKYV